MHRFLPLLLTVFATFCFIRQSYADRAADSLELVKLYNSTDGAMWSITWDLQQPMNTWFGISLDDNGQVISVSLPGNNLKGALPNLALPQCRLLSLSRNTLRDTLPLLGGLPNVLAVDLSRNEIDGHLFDFNMPKIDMLDLSYNKIQGSIPDFSKMTSMNTLRLQYNRLDGTLPDFSKMRSLLSLNVSGNFLEGPIPEFNFLPDLITLLLNDNQFVGSAPAFRGSPGLFLIDLSNNDLSGFMPSFTRQSTLEQLNVSGNRIVGPISNFSANKLLKSIDISNNLLEGSLPDIKINTSLTDFKANGNNFSGPVPSYAGLNLLQRLDISNNMLGDTLPDLSYLPALVELRVDSNLFKVSEFDATSASTLQVLEVQGNRFTFRDIFGINGLGLNRFIYGPQQRIPLPDTIYATIHEDIKIDLIEDFDVGGNSYEWFHDDVSKLFTAVNELQLGNINALDQGTYYARVTNDALPGLILLSEEVYLLMDCPYNEVVIIDSICVGDTLFVNNKPYFETGDYRDTVVVPSPNVCDSIFIITLSVYPTYDTTLFDTICESDQIMFAGQTIEESGMYIDTLTSIHGCDSIVQLNLVVWPAYTRARDVTICAGDTLYVGNIIHTSSGLYHDTLPTIHGCDSVIITDLMVMDSFLSVTNVALCFGETYEFRGTTYDASGTYLDRLTSSNGCDSTYRLNLFIPESDHYPLAMTICGGDSVMVGTSVYRASGTYTDSLVTSQGCDSIVVLTLNVVNKFEQSYDLTICRGDTLFFGTDTLTTTGIYIDSLTANGGCDSIVKVVLNILDFVSVNVDTTICFGDSIRINDNVYKVDGTFRDTLTGERCDTIVTTTITVNSEIVLDGVRTVIDPSGIGFIEPTIAGGTMPYRYHWSTGVDTEILDSVQAGDYGLTITDQNGCMAAFNLSLDPATSVTDLFAGTINIKMYPNPIQTNQIFNVVFEGGKGEDFLLSVYDLNGREVQRQQAEAKHEYEIIQMEAPVYSGLYTLKISDQKGRFTVRKLLVH